MADRFLQDIREALAGRDFSFDSFEECVCDLLREVFPGIVSIRGGDDAGMDGAIPDPDGRPIPVVVTTGEDAIGNLDRNLDRYLGRGGQARRVVFATSRGLTPRRRRNLEERAREKGFDSVQIFDGRSLAWLFYRRPEWCRSLLGLGGQPAALSEVPLTRRPLFPIALVGRDVDLEWLRGAREDGVLIGEPGSGKTFLLRKLAEEGRALFLASRDETAIANDLRRASPSLVVVDDAHTDLRQIALLRRLRQGEVGAKFSIVATTWPWDRFVDDVAEALGGVSETRRWSLGLLTRDEIVEVVNQVGVHEPVPLVRAIVDQSKGKPGLAVTLAMLCLQGEYASVVTGEALSRNLLSLFRDSVGPESVSVLACFAMGGDRGMEYGKVAEFLGLSLATVREMVTAMAAGGVLATHENGVLSVEPKALRAALVRDEILDGTAPLDHRQLIGLARGPTSAVDVLVASLACGATLDRTEVHRYVLAHGSRRAWRTLAAFRRAEATWTLENCCEHGFEIACAALHSAPDLGLERLLREAEEGVKSEDKVFESLGQWIADPEVSHTPVTDRRRLLSRGAVSRVKSGGSSRVFWRAVALALSLKVDSSSTDPGQGMRVTWSLGRLVGPGLEEVAVLWREVRETAVSMDGLTWEALRRLLRPWLNLGHDAPHIPVTYEEEEVSSSLVREVLGDLGPRFDDQPGPASQIQRIGSALGVDFGLPIDPDFETLYPEASSYFEASEKGREAMRAAVLSLGREWAVRKPEDVVKQLAWYEQQAHEVDRLWPRLSVELAAELSRLVDRPEDWIDPLVAVGVRPELLLPFFDRLVDRGRALWKRVALGLVSDERYSWVVAERILRVDSLPEALVAQALEVTDRNPELARTLCCQDDIPTEVRRRLLGREDPRAVLAAAVGHWELQHRGGGAFGLEEAWRSAVLRSSSREVDHPELVQSRDHEFWLGKILASDPDLAFRWVTRRLEELEAPSYVSRSSVFNDAISALDQGQRRRILERTPPDGCPRGLVALLIGRDALLYEVLVGRPELEDFHLEPLHGRPDEGWWRLARLAAVSGYDPTQIAEASLGSAWVVLTSGSGIERWRAYEECFEKEETSEDPTLRLVAEAGLQLVRRRRQRAEERESGGRQSKDLADQQAGTR